MRCLIMKGNSLTSDRDYLIHKSVYENAKDPFGDIDILKIKRLAAREDVFEIIRSHHLMKQHAGARNTWLSVHQSYSNISREVCELYVRLCHCKVNQRLPARPECIKPILSKTFNDQGQMDLIDMQSIYAMVIHGSCITRTI